MKKIFIRHLWGLENPLSGLWGPAEPETSQSLSQVCLLSSRQRKQQSNQQCIFFQNHSENLHASLHWGKQDTHYSWTFMTSPSSSVVKSYRDLQPRPQSFPLCCAVDSLVWARHSSRTMLLTGQTEGSMIFPSCNLHDEFWTLLCHMRQPAEAHNQTGQWLRESQASGALTIICPMSHSSLIVHLHEDLIPFNARKGSHQTKNSGEKQTVSNLLSVSGTG